MLDGWPENLAAFIEENRFAPFKWGENDCLTFANGAHRAITGAGFCDDWIIKHSDYRSAIIHYRAVIRREGHNILAAIDTKLPRFDRTTAPRGYIVAKKAQNMVFGYALGVSLGVKIAFRGLEGLAFVAPSEEDVFWAVA